MNQNCANERLIRRFLYYSAWDNPLIVSREIVVLKSTEGRKYLDIFVTNPASKGIYKYRRHEMCTVSIVSIRTLVPLSFDTRNRSAACSWRGKTSKKKKKEKEKNAIASHFAAWRGNWSRDWMSFRARGKNCFRPCKLETREICTCTENFWRTWNTRVSIVDRYRFVIDHPFFPLVIQISINICNLLPILYLPTIAGRYQNNKVKSRIKMKYWGNNEIRGD